MTQSGDQVTAQSLEPEGDTPTTLTGTLTIQKVPPTLGYPAFEIYWVDTQEADPATIKPTADKRTEATAELSNDCHDPDTGEFCETPGGDDPEPDPGREYRGQHQPPAPEDSANITELDKVMPEDIYTHPEYYDHSGGREAYDREAARIIRRLQGADPDTPVKIYRAAPPGLSHINKGDWVTISKTYAKQHGYNEAEGEEDWPVYEITVPAKDVYFGGNDIVEQGYWGPDAPATVVKRKGDTGATTASAYVDYLRAKVEEFKNRGNPEALIRYWREGAGAARIGWGTDGDFTRCMRLVGKYLPDDAGGFCQNRHMEIYGESNAARDKRIKAEAAAAASVTGDSLETLHAEHDQSSHGNRSGGYAPDPDAPDDGEYVRDSDGNATHWRQSHRRLLVDALFSWKGAPVTMHLHIVDVKRNAPLPPSGSGKQMRAQAAALLYELEHNAKPNPKPLYRGETVPSRGITGWSEYKRVATKFAKKGNGTVKVLPKGSVKGINTQDYIHSSLTESEREWLIDTDKVDVEFSTDTEPPTTPYVDLLRSKAIEELHLLGQHDQKNHAPGGAASTSTSTSNPKLDRWEPENHHQAAALDKLKAIPSEGKQIVDGESIKDAIRTSARFEDVRDRFDEAAIDAAPSETVTVPTESIIATKPYLKRSAIAAVIHALENPDGPWFRPGYLPIAIKTDDSGDLHLWDGHHRLEGARILNQPTTEVKLIDLSEDATKASVFANDCHDPESGRFCSGTAIGISKKVQNGKAPKAIAAGFIEGLTEAATLHRLPEEFPEFKVVELPARIGGPEGFYDHKTKELNLSNTDNLPLTAVHEFGHYLQYSLMDIGGPTAFNDFYDAAEASRQVEYLLVKGETDTKDPEYYKYMVRPQEIWARAYAQWVVTKGSNQGMKDRFFELDASQHWPPDDFEPIAAEIEKLLRTQGLLREDNVTAAGSKYVDYLRNKTEFYNKCHAPDTGHFCSDPLSAARTARKEASERVEEAITAYTGRAYKNINQSLRGKQQVTPENAERIAALDEAFASHSVTTHGVTVYKGLSRDSRTGPLMVPGQVLRDAGFMSTSADRKDTANFTNGGGTVVIIKTRPGTRAIAGKDAESELILDRGTAIRIKSRKQMKGYVEVVAEIVEVREEAKAA